MLRFMAPRMHALAVQPGQLGFRHPGGRAIWGPYAYGLALGGTNGIIHVLSPQPS